MRITKQISLLSILAYVLAAILAPLSASAYGSQNGRLVYTANPEGVLSGEIFIMNPDGSNQINLTNTVENESVASWTPDGKKILFARGESSVSNDDLYFMNPDGTGITAITTGADRPHIAPVISPDGKYIRFVSNSLVQPDKYANFIMKVDGTGLTEMPILINPDGTVIEGWAYLFQPWSPDSSRIIIPETFDSGMRLYTIKPDGTDPIQISGFLDGYNWAYAQSWSPDSSKIFYEELGEGTTTTHKVVNSSDGSVVAQQNVARGSAAAISVWSEDGGDIIYSAKEEGDSYSVNLFKMSYSSSTFGTPSKLTNYQCLDFECGVYIFDRAQNRIAFCEILPQDFSAQVITNLFAVDSYGSPLNLSNHNPPSGMSKLVLSGFNIMEPLTPPPAPTPTPPKTGKLIGATIATISLISIILLMAKEIKSKHHTLGGER